MPALKTLRQTLATNIANALGPGFTVNAYPLSAPTPPVVEIAQFGFNPHEAMHRGVQTWTCIVRAYLSVVSDLASQQTIDDDFFNNDPITAAIEDTDKTLGGLCDDLIVDRVDQRFWDHPNGHILAGGEWLVRILI